MVGYRVNEVLFGQNNVAVGRTNAVTGSITVDGTSVGSASFTAQMADVHSDQSERDGQFDGRIMEVFAVPHGHLRPHLTTDLPVACQVPVGEATDVGLLAECFGVVTLGRVSGLGAGPSMKWM